MGDRFSYPFSPVPTTAPSFVITADNNSTANALESTGLGRMWQGPHSRSVRLASQGSDDFYIAFGTSLIAASSTDSLLVLGGTAEVFHQVSPQYTYIAVKSSTDVTVNVTIGVGQ